VLEDKPELFSDLIWYWEVYSSLSKTRPIGFNGPLPITFQEIESFCRLKKIFDGETVDDILFFIMGLDEIYIKDFYEKQAKKNNK